MEKFSPSSKRNQWRLEMVPVIKSEVKSEIDELLKQNEPSDIFPHISQRIKELDTSDAPTSQLKRLILVISALVHHQRYSGLSSKQVKDLSETAEAILKVEKINPVKSKFAFLYGELHLVLSQIYRKSGKHLLSAWEQQLALYLSRYSPPGGICFQRLAYGHRAMRLGFLEDALEDFEFAEKGDLPLSQKEKARIGRVKALRLLGRLDESCKMANDARNDYESISQSALLELEWEMICCGVQNGAPPHKMVAAVRKGESHYEATYILEAFLWVRAFKDKIWFDQLPKLSTIMRDTALGVKNRGFLYKAVASLEEYDDEAIPIAVRLRCLGLTVSKLSEFVLVDNELLFLAAVARWLRHRHLEGHLRLVVGQYRSLSAHLTKSASYDALHLLADLV